MEYDTGSELTTPIAGRWAHPQSPPAGPRVEPTTLVDYCRRHATGANATSPAFTHVIGHPGEHDRLTFAGLDARARAIAAEIQRRGGAGQTVLIVCEPGVDYAASLFGCLYARAIAVPVYPPQMLRLQNTLSRLQAIIHNAGAKWMLSTRATIGPTLSPLWQMPADSAILVDEIPPETADQWDERLPQAEDVAILQYTSGSTGNPRGVVLPHHTLLHNLNALVQHYHFPGARSVQWVPPYHDMGLIGGILLPIFHGVETVIVSPTDFVRDPLLWLRCIDHYRGTSNGAPNFGYELCIRRILDSDCEGLDLSSWRVAVAGAEPVRAATLRRFAERFGPYGFEPSAFCPAFGMAESTVVVTSSRLGEPYRTLQVDAGALQLGKVVPVSPATKKVLCVADDVQEIRDRRLTQELVSCGESVAGMHFEIVDPETHVRLPDRDVGEIWVRGGSVASGYWKDLEATERTFQGRIREVAQRCQGDRCGCDQGCCKSELESSETYLRTGDLGARLDGELYVTGRLKELIIVAGRNLYPHDVEQIVQTTSEAFRPDTGTALAIDTGESEELVIVQELSRPKKFDAETLLQELVGRVIEATQVTPYAVVLVRSGSLPKTSSGKLRRTDTKTMLLSGELSEIARWEASDFKAAPSVAFEPPATATENALATIWSSLLNVDRIGRQDDFFALGGGSLLVSRMITEVAERLAVEVPLMSLFREPTLSGFANIVDELSESNPATEVMTASEIPDDGLHPLSSAQQRFWLLDQLGQTDAFLHVPVSIELNDAVDNRLIETAIERLIARHPMLRCRVIEEEGEVSQKVAEKASPRIEYLSEAGLGRPEIRAARKSFANQPMDLSSPPLFRIRVVETGSSGQRIDFVFHHLISDATSIEALLVDLDRCFHNADTNDDANDDVEPTAPPGASFRYVDYAAWDQSASRRQRIESRRDYWRERLAGMPHRWNRPHVLASPPTAPDDDSSAVVRDQLPAEIARRIDRLAVEHGCTASILFLAAWQTVLARYGGQNDFGITIPTSNRPSSKLTDTIGCFLNPVIYRANVSEATDMAALIALTRDRVLNDLEYGDVPFQDVLACVESPRDMTELPLSQVMFLYQPPLKPIERLGQSAVRSVSADYTAVTAYDLSLIVHPAPRPELNLVFGAAISAPLAKRMLASFRSLIDQMAEGQAEDLMIAEVRVPAQAELESIENAEVGAAKFTDQDLIGRLREHALRQPDRVAMEDDHGEMDYATLQAESDRFATALIGSAVQPESLIGVRMPRTTDMVVAILGVWKAACGYVPLDPNLPERRQSEIIADSGVCVVIDQALFDRWMRQDESKQEASTDPAAEPSSSLPSNADRASGLAYVMYTSGSTGRPKGVAVEHRGISNLLDSFADTPGFGRDDCMLAVTTTSFDISVLEMFLPIWCGGRMRLTADRIAEDPAGVVSVIESSRPTLIQSTPSGYRVLLSSGWRPDPATTLICGGEPLMPDLADELLRGGGSLWNVYGPTETTVWSTLSRITNASSIDIGRPIRGTMCKVVDAHGRVCPIGVAGELWIGGIGLARGYHRDPSQTEQRFVNRNGTRFYRTGDRVWRTETGQLAFVARDDRQIKLRGFRVELDEIENVLQQSASVSRAAVIAPSVAGHASTLVAFVSRAGEYTDDTDNHAIVWADQLKRFVGERLPDYMVPPVVEVIRDLPQTPAGKTDYKTLFALYESARVRTPADAHTATATPPQTPIEQELAGMWREVLDLPFVGRDEHFFDLGGNSLMAAQLFARLRERFDLRLPLREIYASPTIAQLSQAIVSHQAKTQADNLEDLLTRLDSLSDDEARRVFEQERSDSQMTHLDSPSS